LPLINQLQGVECYGQRRRRRWERDVEDTRV